MRRAAAALTDHGRLVPAIHVPVLAPFSKVRPREWPG